MARVRLPSMPAVPGAGKDGNTGGGSRLPVHPDLLSVPHVAERLSVTEAAVRKWLAQRRLPVVKVGRLSRIPCSVVALIVERGLPEPGTYPRKPRDH